MPISCSEATEKLAHLTLLKDQFLRALESTSAVKISTAREYLEQALQLKAQLEAEMIELSREVSPFEELFELSKQYEQQVKILTNSGILETLSNGKLGIKSIPIMEGGVEVSKEYAIPTLEEITERMEAREVDLKEKRGQGFTKMLLVPFAMDMQILAEKYGELLNKYHSEGKLIMTRAELKSDPLRSYVSPELSKNHGTDVVYFPDRFDPVNHQGATKSELLSSSHDFSSGWHIIFIEDLPDTPRKGKGETIGGRPQLEAGCSADQYLTTLSTDITYRNEEGLTIEDWFTYAIAHLEEKKGFIDGMEYSESKCYLIGSYNPIKNTVASGSWNPNVALAQVYGVDHNIFSRQSSFRSSMRV